MENKQEFKGLRKYFWPIHRAELKKFIPLTLLFFCISLSYSILRNAKDIYILNSVGAPGLYYIKTFGVTPMVIIYTLIYNSLSQSLGRHKMFYVVIAYFVGFFSLFAFVIMPLSSYLALDAFYIKAVASAPRFIGLWGVMRYWYYSLFYIHAELYGTFGISVVLWTFINEITSVKQSKRFYSFLMIGANIALLFSAAFLLVLGEMGNAVSNLVYLVYLVVALGAATLGLYKWFTKKLYAAPMAYEIESKPAKKKAKLSFVESIKFLFSSRYLGLISILVFSYGFFVSLVEAVWKNEVKALQVMMGGDGSVLTRIYSAEVFLIGSVAILSIVLLSSFVMDKGWRVGALVTPFIGVILGSIFLAFVLFGRELSVLTSTFGVSSILLAVVIGMLQVVFVKAFKYTFFDPTKEATYIPLDQESKIKGKAAVDAIGGRLGKSGGSMLLSFVLIPFFGGGKIDGAIPYIAGVAGLVLFFWIRAVYALDIAFKKKQSEKKDN